MAPERKARSCCPSTSGRVILKLPATGATVAISSPHTPSRSTMWAATRVLGASPLSLSMIPDRVTVCWANASPANRVISKQRARLESRFILSPNAGKLSTAPDARCLSLRLILVVSMWIPFPPLPGRTDRLLELRELRLPAQLLTNPARIGHQYTGITCTPRRNLQRNFPTGNAPAYIYNLKDGEPLAVAQVVPALLARLQRLQGQNVCPRQVAHVDVITNAGPVRRVVIIPENAYRLPPPLGDLEHERYQVRLGPVVLPVAVTCPGRIKVAQRRISHARRPAEPVQGALKQVFGLAVHALRSNGRVLADWHLIRGAEQGGSRGEDELVYSALSKSSKQVERAGRVVAKVVTGLPHRLAHKGVGREVQGRLELMLVDQPLHKFTIANVTQLEGGLGVDGGAVARAEVVEHHHPVATLDEGLHRDAPYVACPSGDENIHRSQSNRTNGGLAPQLPFH